MIDVATDTVVAIIAMFAPVAVAVAPDGTRAYVTDSSLTLGSVSVVDIATNTVTDITIGPNAQGIAVAPDGKCAYGVSVGSDSVWVIDTGANAMITSVTVGSNPVGVAVTPGIGPPTSTDQCKRGGWRSFDVPRSFKNQGECVSFVNTGK